MKDIALPTIHLNGTSPTVIAEDLATASTMLRRAIECLSDAAPNARDYYPQGDAAYPRARREHEDRIARLRAVLEELGAIHEHVADRVGAAY